MLVWSKIFKAKRENTPRDREEGDTLKFVKSAFFSVIKPLKAKEKHARRQKN